ncbi:KTSC domain-containing protein [uncultured Ilyobacter sp.]|uniref:KTSC domain-containing protein n=1 Tax=uncultured Ilyobacter sp. TaxID=544433 RepID=UPI0029C0732C|nr:KTSC domain-containing protein [uncultured Ilyobacter sp.]
MKTKNFKSRLIYSIEYVFSEKLLVVELNKGGLYKYFGVPFSEYLKLRFSKSLGYYYTNFIKDNNKYKVEKNDIIPLKIR